MGLGLNITTFISDRHVVIASHMRKVLTNITHIHWKNYQAKMLAKLKALQEGIVIAGDGRHDSMGHSAKYGA